MAEVEDSNSCINGLLSTPNFLEAQLDWSAGNLLQGIDNCSGAALKAVKTAFVNHF
jgi:hypothetical protein